MTATTEIESKVTELKEENCNICKKDQIPEDIFPIGTQDPVTKVVAVIVTCRTCFVGNLSLELRRTIYSLWDI